MNNIQRLSLLLICVIFFQSIYAQQPDSLKKSSQAVFNLDTEYPFKIKFNNDSISVTNKNEKLILSTIQQLDDYLNANIQNIDKDKVLLDASSKTNSDRIKAVQEILKKYNITSPHKIMMFH